MRLLFEMDKKDHDECTHSFQRDSARSIIILNSKIAMIHSIKYDYYKFPGGGIEKGEHPVEALIRETREEAGLMVVLGTVKEYGYVHRVQKSALDETERFIQNNYYFLCKVQEHIHSQQLDAYEAEEMFTLEYIDPEFAIAKNRNITGSPYDQAMLEREARVLELLIAEHYFDPISLGYADKSIKRHF